MKILYIHQYFKTPSMAGGTRSYEMARRMVDAGHEVTMVTSRSFGSRLVETETLDGIRVVWIKVRYANEMSYSRRVLAFAMFALLSSFVCVRRQSDLVFASSTPLTVIIPALAHKFRYRVPLVFEVRDLWPEVPIALGALQGRLSKGLARAMERVAYRSSARIVALSAGMKAGVVACGADSRRVEVIPNSCDREVFEVDHILGHQFRESRAWLLDRPLVVYAGTMGLVNGLEYMVRLASEIYEIDPEVRLLAMGAGGESERIKRLAAEAGVLDVNLYFEEPVPKSSMPAVLSAADVCASFVLPVQALEANSANKFFDSLAASRPIAINYGGWQAELIESRDCGLVLSLDVTAAASDLVALVRDRPRLEVAGAECHRLAVDVFDRDLLAGKLIDVLESVAQRPDRRCTSKP